LELDAGGLILSALYLTWGGLVLRFYNPEPADQVASLKLPAGYRRAVPADALGRPAGFGLEPDGDGFVRLPVGPFGLKTFLLVGD
jgi:hypothetical protein